ncbi:MAG TPA: aminotransferase class I/II-fold pyridoxal phosphate-dependent enzyme [Oligoflexia bacterium]|nr:aminotransferase class I/II-fold pyridoxal phosphate-dependent enzyme [Oligoflexia bacterium]HMP27160.1 aminotransferase class I/II-fold pyridoxal phosphate-dependent enzyme [Oligoflexia bacterium]
MKKKKISKAKTAYSIESRLIHGLAKTSFWEYDHHINPPLTTSATYRLESAKRGARGFANYQKLNSARQPILFYGRMAEPNNMMLAEQLAIAERGAAGVIFSSGMAAVQAATLLNCQSGDEIVSHQAIYGCSYSLFSKYYKKLGIKTHFTDLAEVKNLACLINQKTRLVYVESLTNPNLTLIDIAALAKYLAKENSKRTITKKILLAVDNTFPTPISCRPLEHGADLVIHSLTKAIGGFGCDIGGAVITNNQKTAEQLIEIRKDFGSVLAPSAAWHILTYGIPTLKLRFKKQSENALEVARFLERHPKIDQVIYPGLKSYPFASLARRQLTDENGDFVAGNMVYFIIKGSSAKLSQKLGEHLINIIAKEAYVITLAVSLGLTKTLIEHPSSMTHSAYKAEDQIKFGINPGGIRLSIGIESARDIIADLERALKKI